MKDTGYEVEKSGTASYKGLDLNDCPVIKYVNEKCIKSERGIYQFTTFFTDLENFCSSNGYRRLGRPYIEIKLKKLGYEAEMRSNKTKYFIGIEKTNLFKIE